MSICVVCHYARLLITWLNLACREKNMSSPTRKMTCYEWREILMADPEREHDALKKEYFGSRLGGSYVLGRSQNRIPNPIMRDVNTL